jgi:TRAP transporter 4TM/12TM fusion protein
VGITEGLINSWKEKSVLTRIVISLYVLVAVTFSGFHLYLAAFGGLEAWRQRSVHLVFVLLLVFLLPKKGKNENRLSYNVWDLICLLGTAAVSAYIILDYTDIVYRGGIPNEYDKIAALALTVLVLEAVRRRSGYPVFVITIVFALYGVFGHYLPGFLGAPKFSTNKLTDQIFNSSAGIFGVPIAACADFIIVFIIFGAFLMHTKAGEAFTQFAFALTGRQRGGPAKAAVVASALVGTVHGSGPGNVVTTGTFTIPLMKKVGYQPKFAGGVEAAASTGGILLPPVMGSAAFIMAAITGIPYGEIIIYAAIPAILYYAAVFWMTHLEAGRMNLKALTTETIPKLGESLKNTWHLFLPLLLLIFLLVRGMTASKAALVAIGVLIVVSAFRKETRMTPKKLLMALEEGASGMLSITSICAAAGIIVGMISLTGLGVKLGAVVMSLAENSLLLALLLTALVTLILGMGMPGVAAYVIVASVIAPSLVNLGLSVIAAHMFAYYYSQLSNVTPPVALASYAAAAIAKSGLWETSWVGFKIASAGLIVPFMFVYSPALLAQGPVYQILWASITGIVGTLALAASLVGFLGNRTIPWYVRVILFGTALLLIEQSFVTDLVGIAILAACYLIYRRPNAAHQGGVATGS